VGESQQGERVLERQFIGFMPDDFVDLYLDAMLRRVAEHAPYESNCHACLEQNRGSYLARIEVETATGPFVGEARAAEPKLALDLAEEQVFRRLEHWRKTRWDDQAA
jgi:hypothetical protein